MHVAAITGFSGAGKTTLIVQLIEHFRREGKRIGAIKHTHHPLNEENRGDTARFRAAGAEPVILANASEGAVIFRASGTSRVNYSAPRELLAHCSDCDVVLVEGFKQLGDWPKLEIARDARPSLEEVLAILDRIWRS
ncbi:MAG TPA: molybdopterin-guanine dinucleotide biosynthesis protein B [Thermoanaerobaculia bacterium]|nr:molybdopterin-guanine dinucleotide biosynthesis protein B [Thermoanaerobaculia bacterium]